MAAFILGLPLPMPWPIRPAHRWWLPNICGSPAAAVSDHKLRHCSLFLSRHRLLRPLLRLHRLPLAPSPFLFPLTQDRGSRNQIRSGHEPVHGTTALRKDLSPHRPPLVHYGSSSRQYSRGQIRPTLRRQACHLPCLPSSLRQRRGRRQPASSRPSLNGICASMDREAKKEAFRKYLESSGVLDTLTKVLVALYEENDKPSSAVEFVQQKLGGPSISDYEKLKAEKLDLQLKYNELLDTHKDTCRQLEELKNMKYGAPWN
ncbi:hypothetical protein PVAP13_2NG065500 [Panicum virgatum]|uniref:c-Myc-binding protein n=5 Tax=Paniceae TaxID=147428 RepID=A0A8T0V624_PANVG|nr:hypothetical protein PVAP13_2NG065500 [Panicum virgatum]